MRRAGFTLIELMVVIVIIGSFLTLVIPRLERLSPVYRLRASARLVGADIGLARTSAIANARPYALHYDLEGRRFWMIFPPKAEDPEAPLEERPHAEPRDLERGIAFQAIIFPDGTSVTGGEADVLFDALGNQGTHIVVLTNEGEAGGTLSVKFNAVTGIVDFFPGVAEFEQYM